VALVTSLITAPKRDNPDISLRITATESPHCRCLHVEEHHNVVGLTTDTKLAYESVDLMTVALCHIWVGTQATPH
jgi:hypothetical protein